jgi:hypothetical protein
MKARAFRKRRHSFNRAASDGIVHVLSFQMGAFDPPGTVEIPGLRPNLYGKFTVNLGVYAPAMQRSGASPSGWVNEYNCQLRMRLGQLLPEHFDVWWNLGHIDAAEDVARAIDEHGLPWLDRLGSYAAILRVYEAEGRTGLGLHPAAPLDIADLHLALGQVAEARAVLAKYVAQKHQPGHAEYIAKYLTEWGLTDLISAINLDP